MVKVLKNRVNVADGHQNSHFGPTKQTVEECFEFLFCSFHVELILRMPSPGVCIAALFPLLGGAPLGAELGSVLGSSPASREQLQAAVGLTCSSGASLQEAEGLGSCWSHCTSGRAPSPAPSCDWCPAGFGISHKQQHRAVCSKAALELCMQEL